jgi:hypothetical protein
VRRAVVFLSRIELSFDDVFFNCLFLAVLLGAVARPLREVFFAGFEVAVFDFAWLLFFFLFLDGIAAVYHRGLSAPQAHLECLFAGEQRGPLHERTVRRR